VQHLDKDGVDVYFDDLQERGRCQCEKEADAFAANALIPDAKWQASKLTPKSNPFDVYTFAATLRISPAIPAGRIQFEAHNYKLFPTLIGAGKVRRLLGQATE
jgi:HTH-type transcriptional regulator/antitoxin HigA